MQYFHQVLNCTPNIPTITRRGQKSNNRTSVKQSNNQALSIKHTNNKALVGSSRIRLFHFLASMSLSRIFKVCYVDNDLARVAEVRTNSGILRRLNHKATPQSGASWMFVFVRVLSRCYRVIARTTLNAMIMKTTQFH